MSRVYERDSDSASSRSSEDQGDDGAHGGFMAMPDQLRSQHFGHMQNYWPQGQSAGPRHAVISVLPGRTPSAPEVPLHHDMTPTLNLGMANEARKQSIMAIDRKRRLTGSTQEGGRRRQVLTGFHDHDMAINRLHDYSPSSSSSTTRSPHTPARQYNRNVSYQPLVPAEVIDLTSSPPITHTPLPSPSVQRTSSSQGVYVVPRWQPDSEVSECPICNRPFTFLFRRHHCRKCGRVVCNECSPHRITIPRQFIVNPPGGETPAVNGRATTVDVTGDGDQFHSQMPAPLQSTRNFGAAVGGGEKVRLCNPCVPDPQPDPQPNYLSNLPPVPPSDLDRRIDRDMRHQPRNTHHLPHPRNILEPFPPAPGQHVMPPFSHGVRSRSSRNHASTFDSFGIPNIPPITGIVPGYGNERHQERPRVAFTGQFPGHGRFHSFDEHRMAQVPSIRPRVRSIFEEQPHSSRNFIPASLLPPQLNEEDMCPVCRHGLPPKGPDGDETARESHIMNCINSRDSSTQASVRSRGMSLASPRGPMQMLAFVATEKDCIGEEGATQECSICMVEYDVGDQLARLECLCKFHRECIVSWFNRKQECPVHKIA